MLISVLNDACFLGVWGTAIVDDSFRNRRDKAIDLRRPLAVGARQGSCPMSHAAIACLS
jgi:hypothetical protein